jgi:hypothetical protein
MELTWEIWHRQYTGVKLDIRSMYLDMGKVKGVVSVVQSVRKRLTLFFVRGFFSA